jgi:hypothetical protein
MSIDSTEKVAKAEDTVMEDQDEYNAQLKVFLERQEWVKQMRLKFCIRPEFEVTKNMIFEDGTLNQE